MFDEIPVLRLLGGGSSGGTGEETHNFAYDLAMIAIFAMLLFYVISSSVIAKKHVRIQTRNRF